MSSGVLALPAFAIWGVAQHAIGYSLIRRNQFLLRFLPHSRLRDIVESCFGTTRSRLTRERAMERLIGTISRRRRAVGYRPFASFTVLPVIQSLEDRRLL